MNWTTTTVLALASCTAFGLLTMTAPRRHRARAYACCVAAALVAVYTLTMNVSEAHASGKQRRTCTQRTADYQYASVSDMEVLTAETLSCRTSAPWVILVHGGSWINGDRSYMTGPADQWYSYGWQTFNIEYRRGTGVTWAMQKNDLTAAYDWVVAHASTFGLDPAKGTAFGFSAGGHMAAWLGNLRPLSSVVSVSGVLQPQRIADDDNGLRPDTEPTNPSMHAIHVREVTMMDCDWASGMTADCRAAWDAFDPETALSPSSASVYALQGDDDPNLPSPMLDAYAYHLSQAGVPHATVHVPGYGHTPDMLFDGTAGSNSRFYAVRSWVGSQW